MLIHASCVARDGMGVLLVGPPGSGKSDLALRLMHSGFQLVADDQVALDGVTAAPPPALAGMIEVRGLGIVTMPFVTKVTLALAVELGRGPRMPEAGRRRHGLPLVTVDPDMPSAPLRVALALDCALGRTTQIAGAFAAC